MEIKERKLKGVFEITLSPILDRRGFFMRTYDDYIFNNHNISKKWVQENHSRSNKMGTIRGLHFQLPPFAETKLVRCIHGSILDVFVDLREDSLTFGQWDCIELTEQNKKMVYIPKGFAHGFCTLTERSEVLYKVDNFYSPDNERGILWNDIDLDIKWPIDTPYVSDKDSSNVSFKEFVTKYESIKL